MIIMQQMSIIGIEIYFMILPNHKINLAPYKSLEKKNYKTEKKPYFIRLIAYITH
jgi:hypothetical protein